MLSYAAKAYFTRTAVHLEKMGLGVDVSMGELKFCLAGFILQKYTCTEQ
jgi:hypothetical protein